MAESSPKVRLRLNGRKLPATGTGGTMLLPPLMRSGTQREDVFLPRDYLKEKEAFDVSPAARGASDEASQVHAPDADGDDVVVLELTDGSLYITSAGRLYDTLATTRPNLVSKPGDLRDGVPSDQREVLFERMRAEGAASDRSVGGMVGGLVAKVFTLTAGGGDADVIVPAALDALGDSALKSLGDAALSGLSWAGTKALMAAIENRLLPGGDQLWSWHGATGDAAQDLVKADWSDWNAQAPEATPVLVFVHGTGSSTLGSFGELRTGDRDLWAALQRKYTGGIFAFEHKTFSESPITNALALARALPASAHVSFVSHSRGGLVCDLMCLDALPSALVDRYAYRFEGTGEPDKVRAGKVIKQLELAHDEHRGELKLLAKELAVRKLVVERYVRAASPAQGTKLASGNFDLFLSGLLTLVGQVPFLFGNPVYSAVKRIVIEIAKRRTDPHLVPGIEAMLPDSPMARLLHDAPVRGGIHMAVLAGDIQGGNLLQRLGVLLTDFVLFDNTDNDLVVDTPAMLSGIAPKAGASVLFDRGADVSHFRYFKNFDTRAALRDWLVAADPKALELFRPLPDPADYAAALAAATASRDAAGAPDRPIVVVLPGVMGSHLRATRRIWFDALAIAGGGLEKLKWDVAGIEADGLFSMFYGEVSRHLAASHRVEPFPYDWRQPLDVLADRLGEFLATLLKSTKQPIRLLAHSMGGLVVRACIHKRRGVIDELMARDGARLVMLGTPNQGAHSMVENLIGKGDTLRTLVRLDLEHKMQGVLDIIAGFRGPLQLLPRPGFVDTFQGQSDGGEFRDYQAEKTWIDLKPLVHDFWFGDNHVGTPTQDVLRDASWLWARDNEVAGADRPPSLPHEYEARTVYVFGVARNTPCGVRNVDGRVKMVGTTRGDGTVTWDSGRIGGIGSFYYMPAQHGDLPSTAEYFPALVDLLAAGATTRLMTQPPAVRDIEQARPLSYDAGPPSVDDADAIQRGLMGGSLRTRAPARTKRRLEVGVRAMDLRFLSQPILVGHYEQDPIAGAEALIDAELLDHDLTERYNMGLYAGPRGSATVVLRVPNDAERARGSLRGAVVTGLGPYDGALAPAALTEVVRAGVLRYLLQVADVLGKTDRGVKLATLLLGYNSSANLTVGASVEALVRGVLEANHKFSETTRRNICVEQLDIVELYVDTAITAVYELRQQSSRLAELAAKQGTTLVVRRELDASDSMRQRLFDSRSGSYWPRLIITDANRDDDQCPPECFDRRCPDGCDPDPWANDAPGAAPAEAGGSPAPDHSSPGAAASMRPPPRLGGGGRGSPRTALADRLRFLYVGQRARAESVMQQRQPGLIESLVRQQIGNKVWNPDFGRMLFQLMVPHDFKDAARQLQQVVLVVDSYTANLPWELMLAGEPAGGDDDALPLALRTAVVRQLSSTRFRQQVRQNFDRNALVIGNPSVAGFVAAFPGTRARPMAQPPQLPGAEAEADGVRLTLKSLGYDVTPAIGDQQTAADVLAKLYRRAYRMVHISAHGVFDLAHVDGGRRSGVVLSDGLLITAAEIASMETVPELVFLNCCHLAKVDIGRDGNKLAASVSRELIEIGVRCVVVAGWAVDDGAAAVFGQTFYEQLLLRNRPFGDAVFEARKMAWKHNPGEITWGAFQAYGDPGWLAEPRALRSPAPSDDPLYASPDELLDDLARTRASASRRGCVQNDRELRAEVKAIQSTLDKRCPPGWLQLPQLQSALGATWIDLDQFELAREALLLAIQAEDKLGKVPIRTIEQLVNVEARLGEKQVEGDLEAERRVRESAGSALPAAAEKPLPASGRSKGGRKSAAVSSEVRGEDLIGLALRRLDHLDKLVAVNTSAASPATGGQAVRNAERSALRGSAYKRKASVHARRLLAAVAAATSASATSRGAAPVDAPAAAPAAASAPAPSAAALATAADAARKTIQTEAASMMAALKLGVEAYRSGEGSPGGGEFRPFNALNRLALDALTAWDDKTLGYTQNDAITLAGQCGQLATQRFAQSLDLWDAVMQPEAKLVKSLLEATLGQAGEASRIAFDALLQSYHDALLNVTLKPAQLDSIVSQMVMLSRFYDALAVAGLQGDAKSDLADAPSREQAAEERLLTADRLIELAQRIQPGRKPRSDRPALHAARAAAAPQTPHS